MSRPISTRPRKRKITLTVDPLVYASAERIIRKAGNSVSETFQGHLSLIIAGAKSRKHTTTK